MPADRPKKPGSVASSRPGRYLYPFAVSERPTANVPWPVVQARLVQPLLLPSLCPAAKRPPRIQLPVTSNHHPDHETNQIFFPLLSQFLNATNTLCPQSAVSVEVACRNPAEKVTMTWNIQSVLSIDTAQQTMRLNMYMRTSWHDWRLAFTEGGAWAAGALPAVAARLPAVVRSRL